MRIAHDNTFFMDMRKGTPFRSACFEIAIV